MTFPGLDPSPQGTGRHPHQVFTTSVIIAVGFVGLFQPVSPAINMAFGPAAATAFYLGLIISGTIVLVGMALPRIEGPLLERIGLAVSAMLLLAYVIAVLSNSGTRGFMAVAFPAGLIAAKVARIIQIGKVLKKIRKRQ